jgi:hypothetical protein
MISLQLRFRTIFKKICCLGAKTILNATLASQFFVRLGGSQELPSYNQDRHCAVLDSFPSDHQDLE